MNMIFHFRKSRWKISRKYSSPCRR